MATKLKNLKVTKVDFVDEGANQRADIKLFKRKDPADGTVEAPLNEPDSGVKKAIAAICKALGIGTDIDEGPEDVQKGTDAQTFGEKMTEVHRQKIADEMWSVCYALQSALQSIVYDEELDGEKACEMMQSSLSDFEEIVSEAITDWSNGKSSNIRKSKILKEPDLVSMETYREQLDAYIQKSKTNQRGELEDMKIDKSKMTPEEKAVYDDIVKKYAVDDEEPVAKNADVDPKENEDEIEDEDIPTKKKDCKKSKDDEGDENIYKGLHPAVAAELASLKKFRQDAEDSTLREVAKRYEIIGKKPEELVPLLKSLKAAGGTAYDDMLGVLDSAVSMAESSGMYDEIGKSRSGGGADADNAWGTIEAKASEIRKSKPEMSYAESIDVACMQNPELVHEYENNR